MKVLCKYYGNLVNPLCSQIMPLLFLSQRVHYDLFMGCYYYDQTLKWKMGYKGTNIFTKRKCIFWLKNSPDTVVSIISVCLVCLNLTQFTPVTNLFKITNPVINRYDLWRGESIYKITHSVGSPYNLSSQSFPGMIFSKLFVI